jgi:NAD(P)-dependent dehydrogenase (short-subunit alcohol dehydrogenase family)
MRDGYPHLKKIKNIKMKKNKNIILTGSEGFIGSFLKAELDKSGYNVIYIDKKNKENKNYFKTDLSKSKDVNKTLKNIKKNYKNIDVLINLAAVQIFTDFEKRNTDELDLMLNVNLKANILLSQFVYTNYFKKQKKGNIINLASIFGLVSPNFNNYKKGDRKSSETYGATKSGIIQLSKYFSNYMSKYNVRVNSLSPGGIENKRVQTKSFINRYKKNVPLKKMGSQEDVINQIMYLISEKSNYITGQNIIIDGGYTAT